MTCTEVTVSYIDRLAEAINDETDPGSTLSDEYRPLYRLYAVLMLAKGEATTLKDVHDAWTAWRVQDQPNHRSAIPFDELSPEVRALDQPYADAIHAVARRLRGLV